MAGSKRRPEWLTTGRLAGLLTLLAGGGIVYFAADLIVDGYALDLRPTKRAIDASLDEVTPMMEQRLHESLLSTPTLSEGGALTLFEGHRVGSSRSLEGTRRPEGTVRCCSPKPR